ncbi:MAG: hypothetical protein NTV52_24120, partial [Acidobacteria bacterium]|nr:hypothetical protein [Acidobacteriota bacterium]
QTEWRNAGRLNHGVHLAGYVFLILHRSNLRANGMGAQHNILEPPSLFGAGRVDVNLTIPQ